VGVFVACVVVGLAMNIDVPLESSRHHL
jgi:hypothetical protein